MSLSILSQQLLDEGEPAQLAAFLVSERSNHISGKLLHVNDDWRRLEKESLTPEAYTLRRIQRA